MSAFIVLMAIFLWLISLLVLAFSVWGTYTLTKSFWRKMHEASLSYPGTAQITAYEVFVPDPRSIGVDDARPQVRLALDCERHGQHFGLCLGPLTCEELFAALDLPAHHVACWLSDNEWRQLLEKRRVTIACDRHQPKAVLTSQTREDRKLLTAVFLSISLFASLVVLSLLQH